jgi:SET domain-containing protein
MFFADIYIAASTNKGKGVFTNEFIAEGKTIEIAPMLILPEADNELIEKSYLYNYYFIWGDDKKNKAIALGYGSIYNHSYEPNVAYKMNFEDETISFVAWRNIQPNEELFINYNGDEDSQDKLWFEAK